ncbi:MAG: EamA family transporter [Acidobacteriaceae bacterium]|jgi:drug/metabolite transporter (DMT)-like permease
MATTTVSPVKQKSGFDVRVFLAFAAIYVLWGSTYLAIRIAVQQVPPLFAAGSRFFLAGTLLYVAMRFCGRPRPSGKEWGSLVAIGSLMFVITYGAVFWAEQYVPSGFTSVLEATLPLITIGLEVFVFRQQRFRWSLLVAIAVGFVGVLLLLMHNAQHVALLPCVAILGGGTAWSLGAVLTRALPLPKSKGITAGAEMMFGGAILLILSALTGEMHPFPHLSGKAVGALLYLVIAGSLLGFSAFVWLLGRMPATRVASHAYINPVVAVALGYFFAGEVVTLRMLCGTALIVASVALILIKDKADVPEYRAELEEVAS